MYLCTVMGRKFSLYNDKPEQLDQDTLLEYKDAVSRYPYCQYAQLMFLLNLEKLGDQETCKRVLPYVAIALPDRERLRFQVERTGKIRDGGVKEDDALGKAALKMPAPRPGTVSGEHEKQLRQIGFVPVVDESSRPVDVERVRAMLHKGHAKVQKSFSEGMTLSVMLGLDRKPSKAVVAQAQPAIRFPAKESRPLVNAVRHSSSFPHPESREMAFPERPEVEQGRQDAASVTAEELIDRFLRGGGEHPIRIDDNFDYASFDPDQGGGSVEDFSFGTETLAEMYLKSHTPEKAIAVYEHLRLKFPEKSSYFAELIQKVKKEYTIK